MDAASIADTIIICEALTERDDIFYSFLQFTFMFLGEKP